MGAQLSTIPQDAEVPLDGQDTPTSAEPGKVGFRNLQSLIAGSFLVRFLLRLLVT